VCVCVGDYETVDHLIWHCERFRLERHRLIDALALLNVSIGQGQTGHCGNAAIATRLFFENARLFLRMRGILKIFSENYGLF
jgi:hypothetical protein